MTKHNGTLAPRITGRTIADDLNLDDLRDIPFVPEDSYDGLRITFTQEVDLDGTGSSFLDCEFVDIRCARAGLDRAHLAHCRFRGCSLAHLSAVRAGMRECVFADCRIGAMDIMDSDASSLVFRNCHIGYLNVRMAALKDMELHDCVIDDLDCAGTHMTRLAFPGTAIGRLDLRHARLQDVDLRDARLQEIAGVEWLRGATMSVDQIADLAQAFATGLGIRTQ